MVHVDSIKHLCYAKYRKGAADKRLAPIYYD